MRSRTLRIIESALGCGGGALVGTWLVLLVFGHATAAANCGVGGVVLIVAGLLLIESTPTSPRR